MDVFTYSNYRDFIRDYYIQRKKKQPSFSYRLLAQKAGINSSSFLKYVIEGKRNLSKSTVEKAMNALNLKGMEREYFRTLVLFNQAATLGENAAYFSQLTELRNHREIKIVEPRDYEFYAEWYHPVVRELAAVEGMESPERMAKIIKPEVSVPKIRESLLLLERLGFIEKQKLGGYVQRNPVVSSGEEIRSAALIHYQIKLFELSLEALKKARPGNYLASSTVLGISNTNFEKAKELIRKCRYKILDLAARENKVDTVHELNIHLFPVAKLSGGE